MKSLLKFLAVGIVSLGLFLPNKILAEIEIPPLSGPVIDQTNILRPEEVQSLSNRIQNFLPLMQLQIWILPSLDGDSIESLSIRATDKWKLGDKKKDNGVLLLVAYKEHQARIEVGRGLEGDIPDAIAGRIIDQVLVPYFKQNAYYDGLELTALSLYQRAGGQLTDEDKKERPLVNTPKRGADYDVILMILLFGMIGLISRLGRGRTGMWYGGTGWSGGSGGWGGGFGGGSGWGGGGGGFSGGGASGSW